MDLVTIILVAVTASVLILNIADMGSIIKDKKSSKLIKYGAIFAIGLAVLVYWRDIRSYMEGFGNYGATCPVGYAPGVSPTGVPDCVPVGGHR